MKKITALFFVILLMPVSASAQLDSFAIERLEEIQKDKMISINDSQKEKVLNTCTSNKQKLEVLQNNNDQAVRKRLIIYGDIQKELKALELRISRQGADASELDLLIGSVDQQLDNLRELSRWHDNLVSDLNSIDCKSRPELYVAGIEQLREVRSDLLEQSRSLRSTIIESPNTTFKPLIERLLI